VSRSITLYHAVSRWYNATGNKTSTDYNLHIIRQHKRWQNTQPCGSIHCPSSICPYFSSCKFDFLNTGQLVVINFKYLQNAVKSFHFRSNGAELSHCFVSTFSLTPLKPKLQSINCLYQSFLLKFLCVFVKRLIYYLNHVSVPSEQHDVMKTWKSYINICWMHKYF
jgi:hypothetical protein